MTISAGTVQAVLPASPAPMRMGDPVLLSSSQARAVAFRDELRQLVAIDSGSGQQEGLDQVADFLAQRLSRLGAQVERIPANPSAGEIVVGRIRGRGSRQIMLMVHYDTIFPDGEADRRPFRVEAGRAFGPGVADAKGGVVMILQALELLLERKFTDFATITVLFNPDEEIGSRGSSELIARLAADQDVVFSFEPSPPDSVIKSTKGIAYLTLSVEGRAAHAGASPESGRNAAVELAHQILALQELGDSSKGTTVNWTRIRAGDRPNVIPADATATADMRFSDPTELVRVRDEIKSTIQRRRVANTSATLTVRPQRPPFPANAATQRLVRQAQAIHQELGLNLKAVAMGFGTDAGHAYQPGKQGPAVLEGLGVVGGNLHSPAEWADLESVPARLYLVVRLLETRPCPLPGPEPCRE
ncbi:M20/M25/M40 family metallo-hydrolase [Cyanobium sp. LEGE 06143]|uniref:glutamate carboxypeptidase n=1 Tax=Cyanobium sp. LEGE 06143 TaxID=945727 RepID=UPI00187DF24E|nr:glutamate carboxypeptidase [Cyanobium sp. LEGE 06143]MBE9173324.1 M20/M25/M40 family metallo-hydrolase [Cyanobium sp. LEGE 06143]